MRKKTLRKEFYRTVRGSFSRFASIFLIVSLGVAFFSGVRASEPDMRLSADVFYDESRLMDIRVLSELGLTQEDVSAIRDIEGVDQVMPSYSQDVLCDTESSQLVVKLMSVPDTINRITVLEGRLPEKSGECLADTAFIRSSGYGIGDGIHVKSGTKEDIGEQVSRQDYTITGIGSTSYYLSLDRGTSKIGSGDLNSFLVIPEEDFALSAYTEIYVTVKGAREDTAYSEGYDQRVEEIAGRIEDIADARCEIRYTSLREEADEKIEDGEKKISDAEQQLSDALTELEEGRRELADAEKELQEGKEELKDGEKTLTEKEAEVRDGEKELADAAVDLADAEQELADARQELLEGKEEIEENQKKLDDGLLESMAAGELLREGRKELEQAKKTLAEKESELEAGELKLQSQEQAVGELKAALSGGGTLSGNEYLGSRIGALTGFFLFMQEAGRLDETLDGINAAGIPLRIPQGASPAEVGESLKALAAQGGTGAIEGLTGIALASMDKAQEELTQARQVLSRGRKELEGGKEKLAEKEKELQEGEDELSEAQFDIREGYKKLADAKKEWEDGQAEYEDGLGEYEDGKKEYEDGVRELEDGKKKLADARRELADAKEELKEGEQKLADGQERLLKGQREYDDADREAEEKLRDAREKIADAKEKLMDLEIPEWYVLDRDYIQTYVEYGQDAERIGAIGRVFPIIFFLVAALVSLTTMTRMVEEERTQIGTHKALGYGNLDIAAKYIWYALSASLLGSLFGLVLGQKLLPVVIIKAYGILYNNLPDVVAPLNLRYSILATLAAVACTVGAAVLACYKELAAAPAILMRPEAPKAGKRVFLERVGFIWKRLNFTGKAAVRNLIRYKKRFFMTIFGIGGCTALVLVGFGIKDSIMAVGDVQFGQIRTYQAEITLDEDAAAEQRSALETKLNEDARVLNWVYAKQAAVEVDDGEGIKNAYLVVPERTEELSDFIKLRDRRTGEAIELSGEGAVITEKLSKLLGAGVGDRITLKPDDAKEVQVQVTGVVENYFMHYVYMSGEAYEKAFSEKLDCNSMFTKNTESGQEYEDQMGRDYMELAAVGGVTFISGMSDRVRNMLKSMDTVIYVLVVSAGMLAFVVLYNLNNINMTERKRELATLKVLGFYDIEVSGYMLRENVMLTVIGTAAGIGMGILLHRYVIGTVEIDMLMFGRNIKPASYLYSILLTFLFSAVVNFAMHFRMKRIDMIESLKSVE